MSYHVIKTIRGHDYHYIVKSERQSGRVRVRILEYLGRDPERTRLKRAIEYWGVKAKHKTRRGRR
jgi:hypothetical protein